MNLNFFKGKSRVHWKVFDGIKSEGSCEIRLAKNILTTIEKKNESLICISLLIFILFFSELFSLNLTSLHVQLENSNHVLKCHVFINLIIYGVLTRSIVKSFNNSWLIKIDN